MRKQDEAWGGFGTFEVKLKARFYECESLVSCCAAPALLAVRNDGKPKTTKTAAVWFCTRCRLVTHAPRLIRRKSRAA